MSYRGELFKEKELRDLEMVKNFMEIRMWHLFILSSLLLSSVMTASCAFDLAHVSTQATQFSPMPEAQRTILLQEVVEIDEAPCDYDRTLRQGTRWKLVGKLPEGDVFKPLDQVLTVECSNIFEAYLVVMEDFLVGFYLPVEKTFVPLSEKTKLPII